MYARNALALLIGAALAWGCGAPEDPAPEVERGDYEATNGTPVAICS